MTTQVQQLKQRLQAASAVVAAARQTIEDGNLVDLTGLEREVASICEGLNALPSAETPAFKAPLVALADDLDRLTHDLTRSQRKLGKEIGGVVLRQKVAKAYGPRNSDDT